MVVASHGEFRGTPDQVYLTPSAQRAEIGLFVNIGVPYGSRTRVAAVKGRCPRPLDERDA